MLDSIHPTTHENLQLGEGVLLTGLDLDAVLLSGDAAAALAEAMQDENRLIGATKEGALFRCVPKMLDTTRGLRTPAAGEVLTGAWQVTLSGTLLEITPGNAAMLLNLPRVAEEERTVIAPEPPISPQGTENVCWVGSTGSGLLAIELISPVSTGGMALRSHPQGTGETPFTLLAQKRAPADAALPCRLLWLKGGAA